MKLNKRTVALLVSLVVLLIVAVGTTIAFLADRTPEVENVFTPSRVACTVTKAQEDAYFVTNTGDTDAFVRVAIVVNWKNGNNVYAQAPQFKVDVPDGWTLGSDGYYYYKNPLNTSDHKDTAAFEVTQLSATGPDGYTFSVEVLASAIQATADAVKEWSDNVASIDSDGNLSIIN